MDADRLDVRQPPGQADAASLWHGLVHRRVDLFGRGIDEFRDRYFRGDSVTQGGPAELSKAVVEVSAFGELQALLCELELGAHVFECIVLFVEEPDQLEGSRLDRLRNLG